MSDVRIWALLLGLGLLACTRAPAPCSDHLDCPAARCVNGACVPLVPLDAGAVFDGGIDAGDGGPVTDDGVPDAMPIMDAQPRCEHLMFDAQIVNGAVEVRRDEPVEISVSVADGAIVEYVSSAGGAFVDQPTGTVWIARDLVDWPWQTDQITLTVTATLDDCRLERRLPVTLLGDVLVGDILTGRLDVFGSNGTAFGQWRLIDGSGVSAMARMPDGGFIVAIRGESVGNVYSPEIVRLNANGEDVGRFVTEDIMGMPIFTRPIEHLYVRDGLVIASNAGDDSIRWYTFEGALQRTVDGGGNWIESLAPRGDTVVFSRDREARVFELQTEDLAVVARTARGVYGLYPLRDGSTLMVQESNESMLDRLDPEGRVLPVADLPQGFSVSALTHFDEGYLALSQSNGRIMELDAELVAVEDFEFGSTVPANPRAIVWLHSD